MSEPALPSPNIDLHAYRIPQHDAPRPGLPSTHSPRILLLYGSVRERSYSRLLSFEAARLLESLGAETDT